MAVYTVAATAVTLGMPVKWVDNTLSHHRIPGVSHARQGVSRRLSPQAILILEIALRISTGVKVPLSPALKIATRLAQQPGDTLTVDAGRGISISVAASQIREELLERLAHAVEVAPSPRRGRPSGP